MGWLDALCHLQLCLLFETQGLLIAGQVTRLNLGLASAKSLTWSLLLVIVTDGSVQIIIAMGWRAIVDPLYERMYVVVRPCTFQCSQILYP